MISTCVFFFFFSSRRRHTRFDCDWSSDVCSSDLSPVAASSPPERMTGTMKRICSLTILALASGALPAHAATSCPADAVLSGPLCVDKYEASVWETSDKKTIEKIRSGEIKKAKDLAAATARGTAGCTSDVGAYDMVGNVSEWVADWIDRKDANVCTTWPAEYGTDLACIGHLDGDDENLPAAIFRGLNWGFMLTNRATDAGAYAFLAIDAPSKSRVSVGFRCARQP